MTQPKKSEAINTESMAKAIDHTLLKPDAVPADIEKLAKEAIQYDFGAVCVNSCHVPLVAKLLSGGQVEVCTVVGFPLGAMDTKTKAFEAKTAVEAGATELDMVINVGALKSGDLKTVEDDIRKVKEAAGKDNVLKVIIETCLLTQEEKVQACELSKKAGADFIKTSTGFSTGGATIEDVQLMKTTVGDGMQVKASGGIKDWATAEAMLKAGASRIGTSSGVEILQGAST
jgi:deoxyribose-phosphate aldolase